MGLLDDIEGKEHEHASDEGEKSNTPPGKGGAKTPDAKKQHRDNLIIILVGVLGVIVTFLIYRKNQEAASSASGTSATGTSNGDVAGEAGSSQGDPYADQMVEQLQAQQDSQTSAIQGLQTMIGNLGSELSELGSGPPATSNPATQTPVVTNVNAANYAHTVSGAQLQSDPTGYTAVGYYGGAGATDFQGAQVAGGAPVYASIFGGLAQGDSQGFSQVPAGTELYVPSQFAGNIQGTPAYAPGAAHTL